MLVTVAENIKLLVGVPLLVGLLAYAASNMLPKSFDSVSAVRGDQQLITIALSDAVLDGVAASTGMPPEMSIDAARTNLQSRIKIVFSTKEKPLVFTVSGPNPLAAKNTAVALLKQMELKGAPKEAERDRLVRMQSDNRARAALAERALSKINAHSDVVSDPSSLALKYADLLASLSFAQSELYAVDALLQGFKQSQVVQAPSLPSTTAKPDMKAIAATWAMGAGMVVILFVFIRENLRRVSLQPGAAEKLMRIRRALRVAPRAKRALHS